MDARRLVPLLAVAVMSVGTPAAAQEGHPQQHQHGMGASSHALIPAREVSGTSWQPDDTPMYGVGRTLGTWEVMVHGTAFAQILFEPGDRHRTGGFSDRQVSSVNWLMAVARRPAGNGRVGVRAMGSVEPWTVADCGFINLLATGEVCEGDTIHDRQHPHDLVMELAADYDAPLTGSLRWQMYGGLAGEPALGPAGFPHRLSAMPNPVAPIGHHWLDSSHVTFGLVTAGVYDDRWKAEMSVFNGREPDANRADLDLGPLDSISGRLTLLPASSVALQISAGHLEGAEAEPTPDVVHDVDRITASVTYHRTHPARLWATTLAYGLNAGRESIPGGVVDLKTHAALFETNLTIRERHAWFGRAEIAGKPGHDLHVHESPGRVFTVAKLQAGYVRTIATRAGIAAGIGATATASIVPSSLAARYSNRRISPGVGLFFTVRPTRHEM